MIKYINKLTGSLMYVQDDRAKEYDDAGHDRHIPDAPAAEAEKKKPAARKRRTK